MATMTKPVLKLTTIVSLVLFLTFSASATMFEDDEEVDEYVLDNPDIGSLRTRSQFLAATRIKKGTHCNPKYHNVCNGVYANNGTSLLNCCKTHCRNIHGDRNNCGKCGSKCKLGELCCNGTCTNIAYNVDHCGKCGKKCGKGISCVYGNCGYA